MFDEALRKAIAPYGTISRFAQKLGTRRENVSAWLNRNIRITLEYALKIDQLTNGSVSWEELVSPDLVHLLKERVLQIQQNAFVLESVYVSIARIQCRHCLSKAFEEEEATLAKNRKADLQKPICVDSENTLIFGETQIRAYEALGKKTIPSWRISLADLINNNYSRAQLGDIFTVSERVAISLALEKRLGNRQGLRKNKPFRENFPEITGRTDDHIAKILSFGNHKTYQHAKKIVQCGCYELIIATDEQRIAISSAALLAQLPQNEQQQILCGSSKEIASTVNQIRNRNRSHSSTHHSPQNKESL